MDDLNEKIDDLKLCPFCGCKCEVVDAHNVSFLKPSGYFKIVGNHDEDCVFSWLCWNFLFENVEDAIEAWNRRINNDRVE